MPNYHTEIGGAIDADHTYLNISINNDNVDTQRSVPLVFNETRSVPIVVNPSEHFMSVIRFSLDTVSLPVLFVQPRIGAPNRASENTVYSITVTTSTGATRTQYVTWTGVGGTGPITSSDLSNPLFNCYSYEKFLVAVNSTLNALVNQLGITLEPALFYDAKTNLITLTAPLAHFRTDIDGNNIPFYDQTPYPPSPTPPQPPLPPPVPTPRVSASIFFNEPLYNLFSSLASVFVGGSLGYKMVFYTGSNIPNLSLVPLSPVAPPYYATNIQPYILNVYDNAAQANNDFIKNTQEYPSIALWTPVKSIIFKTVLLTNIAELQGAPKIFGYPVNNAIVPAPNNNPPSPFFPYFGTPTNYNPPNADVLNILVEHSVKLTSGTEYKPYVFYEPTGEYRLTDLIGEMPINQLDISVYYKDDFGALIPLYLPVGCSAGIKILFRKKSFNY